MKFGGDFSRGKGGFRESANTVCKNKEARIATQVKAVLRRRPQKSHSISDYLFPSASLPFMTARQVETTSYNTFCGMRGIRLGSLRREGFEPEKRRRDIFDRYP